MKQRLALLFLLLAAPAFAGEKILLNQSGGGVTEQGGVGDAAKVTKATTDAGEDVLNDVQKVEERWMTMPSGGSTPKISADQLYKSGVGVVRSLSCFSDAAATAGTIAVLDSTSAGAGTKIYEFDVLAVAYTTPFTVDLGVPFSVGLYLDFTTTADMQCTLRYR